jgi:hypothetical protein
MELEYCSPHTIHRNPGLVYLNTHSGDRCVLENLCYKEMKAIAPLNQNLHYQYLCISRIHKTDDFIRYFPLYKKQCSQFNDIMTTFVNNLHKAYLQVYVYKTVNLEDISAKYNRHVVKLHKTYYLPFLGSSIRPRVTKGPKVTKDVVKKYLNDLEPGELLYLFYYERRLLV